MVKPARQPAGANPGPHHQLCRLFHFSGIFSAWVPY